VHGADGMMKTGVNGSRVDQVSQPKLPYVPHSLKERMFHKIKNGITFDRNKPIYGVVDDFILVQDAISLMPHLCQALSLTWRKNIDAKIFDFVG